LEGICWSLHHDQDHSQPISRVHFLRDFTCEAFIVSHFSLIGKWADGLSPPWSADYHLDINLQMKWVSLLSLTTVQTCTYYSFTNQILPIISYW
jgi:hypothetical protein